MSFPKRQPHSCGPYPVSKSDEQTFQSVFGVQPEGSGSAPGRVNLLGDHTDYSGGFVLPTTIPQRTVVDIGVHSDEDEVYSATLGERVSFARTEPPPGFARYIAGCLRVLEAEGFAVPPLRLTIRSDVPVGAGLSSSAALEVATLRAVDARFQFGLDPVRLALLAQAAEVKYAGVACGILDQMACSLGRDKRMLFLDTLTLERELLPLPDGAEVLVIDSGVQRRLVESAYNTRRAECVAAAEALGVERLRDASDLSAVERLPSPLRERARHVVSENARVLSAKDSDAITFGSLMNQSHNSLSRDYAVSIPEVDRLALALQQQDGVFGARMTGAGFGGACVALVREGHAASVGQDVLSCLELGEIARPRVIVPKAAA